MLGRRDFLKKSVDMGMGIAGAILIPSISFSQITQSDLEKRTKAMSIIGERKYELIREIGVKQFLDNYLQIVTKRTDSFKALEKKYGYNDLLIKYCLGHEETLWFAIEHREEDFQEIPKNKIKELGQTLSNRQFEFTKGLTATNHKDFRVVQSYMFWGRWKAYFFSRLIKNELDPVSEGDEEIYWDLVKKAFSEDEILAYVNGQNASSKRLYGALRDTIAKWKKILGAKKIANEFEIIEKETYRVYNRIAERAYPHVKFDFIYC